MNHPTHIAYLLNSFGTLTETFIAQEIDGLQKRGLPLKIYSLFKNSENRQRENNLTVPAHHLIPVSLPALFSAHLFFMFAHPLRYWKTFFYAAGKRETASPLIKIVLRYAKNKKLDKECRQDMLLHFFLAPRLALQIKKNRHSHILAHFADAASSFALLSSMLTGIPYSISAHAYDIFTPQANPREKFANAHSIVTCTKYNQTFLRNRFPELRSIHVFYHGIDTRKFYPFAREHRLLTFLSIGRLVEKKGFDTLIHACKILKDEGAVFRLVIIGRGTLEQQLLQQIRDNDLIEQITIIPAVPRCEMENYYKNADAFVMPCRIAANGDRDGIPNVIAEAMAMQLPVISTSVSGIPELVQNGRSGFLIEPDDPRALAERMTMIMQNPAAGAEIGVHARERVCAMFDSEHCLDKFYQFAVDHWGRSK